MSTTTPFLHLVILFNIQQIISLYFVPFVFTQAFNLKMDLYIFKKFMKIDG